MRKYIPYLVSTALIIAWAVIMLPDVKAPCCEKGCYPKANCCVTNNPETNPFFGMGVVGCPAKVDLIEPDKIQWFCDGDSLATQGSDVCGSCLCLAKEECLWQINNGPPNCDISKFCGIAYDGKNALNSKCLPRCPEGTQLCNDNSCNKDCESVSKEAQCDGDCNNGKADSCACPECYSKQATCESGLVCDQYTELCTGTCPCPEDTTLCIDGLCRTDCYIRGAPGNTPDTGDNICNACNNPQEGCTVNACDSEKDPCDPGLYCHNDLCKKIPGPGECDTCNKCETFYANCQKNECHSCDLSKCYFKLDLLVDDCHNCPGTVCSDYNNDEEACNGLIPSCIILNTECYWDGGSCKDCSGINQCQDYTDPDTCIADPCNVDPCIWKDNKCIPLPEGDPDDSPELCEAYDPSAEQGNCDHSGETNCWDEEATDTSAPIKCCGDDKPPNNPDKRTGKFDNWKDDNGAGCVDGVYWVSCNDNKLLSVGECTDGAIDCWSSIVQDQFEDSELIRCCQTNEHWTYSTNEELEDIMVSESCAITEWFQNTRANSVTYYELKRS